MSDLRFCNYVLPAIPAGTVTSQLAFMAPEIRQGAAGDPAADVYTVGALLYYAVTGQEPPLDPEQLPPPSQLRPATPRAIERIILRALSRAPESRYFTAAEMLEDLAADAGLYVTLPVGVG